MGDKKRVEYHGIISRKIDVSKEFRDFRDRGYAVFDQEGKG